MAAAKRTVALPRRTLADKPRRGVRGRTSAPGAELAHAALIALQTHKAATSASRHALSRSHKSMTCVTPLRRARAIRSSSPFFRSARRRACANRCDGLRTTSISALASWAMKISVRPKAFAQRDFEIYLRCSFAPTGELGCIFRRRVQECSPTLSMVRQSANVAGIVAFT